MKINTMIKNCMTVLQKATEMLRKRLGMRAGACRELKRLDVQMGHTLSVMKVSKGLRNTSVMHPLMMANKMTKPSQETKPTTCDENETSQSGRESKKLAVETTELKISVIWLAKKELMAKPIHQKAIATTAT